MKNADVTRVLKLLGWLCYTDEVGDKYTHFRLPDRVVQIVYGVRKYGGEQQFEATLSLTTESFSSACFEIRDRGGKSTPLVRSRSGLVTQVPVVLEEHVRQASGEAIAWAKDQDLDKALREYEALPTTAPGARPVWHLGALAVLGDVHRLQSYQASFESGDRLGFVNYVTKDYIDRAVILAEQNASTS